ncbi:hypothetical protein SAMN05216223_10934 [Actinacidiphila yanglinensis]|uniref:Glycosyl hydrolase family 95 catalytic domain-containing protein n=1 Tax=Actinacidiphila yanglinensis TaxID=310779 RepID=A0A1H6CJ17_9ACTN|nr:hypothetical protein SAMN05216223_10934 [Actinacidiphila yanglinensis]
MGSRSGVSRRTVLGGPVAGAAVGTGVADTAAAAAPPVSGSPATPEAARYKVASAARRDAPVMATTGPWLEPTPWPASWWNLNVQLEYWLIHGSNHLELDGLTRSLSEFRENVRTQTAPAYRSDSLVIARSNDTTLSHGADAGPDGTGGGIPGQDAPTPEVGNLTWALHNVWLSYRHTMDESILRDVVFPLLRQSINYYLHFLEPGSDGRLHLPTTFSPEYGVNTPDTNYDLALIRWGCTTLLESARILGVDDPLAPRWRDVLLRLVAPPTDTNGFMLYSEAGAPCVVRTDLAGPLEVRDGAGRALPYTDLGGGTLRVELDRGQEAWLYPRGSRPSTGLAPVAANAPAHAGACPPPDREFRPGPWPGRPARRRPATLAPIPIPTPGGR